MLGKTSFYQSNGSGRDSYINCNSGGLRSKHHALSFAHENTINDKERNRTLKFRMQSIKPGDLKIVNAAVKYYGDGSGRDAYVVTDYGGSTKYHKSRMEIVREYQENKISFAKNRQKSIGSAIKIHGDHRKDFKIRRNLSMSVNQLVPSKIPFRLDPNIGSGGGVVNHPEEGVWYNYGRMRTWANNEEGLHYTEPIIEEKEHNYKLNGSGSRQG